MLKKTIQVSMLSVSLLGLAACSGKQAAPGNTPTGVTLSADHTTLETTYNTPVTSHLILSNGTPSELTGVVVQPGSQFNAVDSGGNNNNQALADSNRINECSKLPNGVLPAGSKCALYDTFTPTPKDTNSTATAAAVTVTYHTDTSPIHLSKTLTEIVDPHVYAVNPPKGNTIHLTSYYDSTSKAYTLSFENDSIVAKGFHPILSDAKGNINLGKSDCQTINLTTHTTPVYTCTLHYTPAPHSTAASASLQFIYNNMPKSQPPLTYQIQGTVNSGSYTATGPTTTLSAATGIALPIDVTLTPSTHTTPVTLSSLSPSYGSGSFVVNSKQTTCKTGTNSSACTIALLFTGKTPTASGKAFNSYALTWKTSNGNTAPLTLHIDTSSNPLTVTLNSGSAVMGNLNNDGTTNTFTATNTTRGNISLDFKTHEPFISHSTQPDSSSPVSYTTTDCGNTLKAGQHCTFTMTYSPKSASKDTGQFDLNVPYADDTTRILLTHAVTLELNNNQPYNSGSATFTNNSGASSVVMPIKLYLPNKNPINFPNQGGIVYTGSGGSFTYNGGSFPGTPGTNDGSSVNPVCQQGETSNCYIFVKYTAHAPDKQMTQRQFNLQYTYGGNPAVKATSKPINVKTYLTKATSAWTSTSGSAAQTQFITDLNSHVSHNYKLHNSSQLPISINVALTTTQGDFLAEDATFKLSNNTCTETLAPGASCQVQVTYTPQGDNNDNILLSAGNAKVPVLPLTGNLPPAQITATFLEKNSGVIAIPHHQTTLQLELTDKANVGQSDFTSDDLAALKQYGMTYIANSGSSACVEYQPIPTTGCIAELSYTAHEYKNQNFSSKTLPFQYALHSYDKTTSGTGKVSNALRLVQQPLFMVVKTNLNQDMPSALLAANPSSSGGSVMVANLNTLGGKKTYDGKMAFSKQASVMFIGATINEKHAIQLVDVANNTTYTKTLSIFPATQGTYISGMAFIPSDSNSASTPGVLNGVLLVSIAGENIGSSFSDAPLGVYDVIFNHTDLSQGNTALPPVNRITSLKKVLSIAQGENADSLIGVVADQYPSGQSNELVKIEVTHNQLSTYTFSYSLKQIIANLYPAANETQITTVNNGSNLQSILALPKALGTHHNTGFFQRNSFLNSGADFTQHANTYTFKSLTGQGGANSAVFAVSSGEIGANILYKITPNAKPSAFSAGVQAALIPSSYGSN